MTTPLESNIELATRAIKHVRLHMASGPGPDNQNLKIEDGGVRVSGEFHDNVTLVKNPQGGYALSCAEKIKREVKNTLPKKDDAGELEPFQAFTKRLRASQAEMARVRKCGNCAEMSVLAMDYLANELHVTSWITLFDLYKIMKIDHQFLVIGLDNVKDTAELRNPDTWDGNAVICDPWHGRRYPKRDIHQGMYRGILHPPGSGGKVTSRTPRYRGYTKIEKKPSQRVDLTAMRPFRIQPVGLARVKWDPEQKKAIWHGLHGANLPDPD